MLSPASRLDPVFFWNGGPSTKRSLRTGFPRCHRHRSTRMLTLLAERVPQVQMRVLIVDDHELVRSGIRSLLAPEAVFTICGEATDGHDAIEKAKTLHPDVVIMDISMPTMNGLEATREIKHLSPDTEIVIVSQHDVPEMVRQAFSAGARAYVVKSAVSTELLAAIHRVSQHEVFINAAGLSNNGKDFDAREILQRSAAFEQALRTQLADTRLLQNISGQLLQEENVEGLYEKILDAAVGIMRSDYASMQMLYPERGQGGELRLLAFRGFNAQAAKFWEWVGVDSGCTCGAALHCGKRVIVPDVEKCDFMAGTDHLATYLQTGIHAVQSTPLISRRGDVVGMISTHWRHAHQPSEQSLHLLDIVARQAADLIERGRTEQVLKERVRLLDLSYDAIIVRDATDRVQYWNAGASEMYGYHREEALGRVTHELLRTDFPMALERITEHLHQHERWTGELVHTRKDGARIVVVSRWALERDEHGNPKRILETNSDITPRKHTEERLRGLTETLEEQARVRTEELERRNTQVAEQAQQLRELSRSLMQLQDDERRRIARELHDSAGQNLGALSLCIANIAHQAPHLAKITGEGQQLVEQISQELRTTSYLLHPPLLDENGLRQALLWYVGGLQKRGGLDITLSVAEDLGRLSRELELTIFRIVQECLTNMYRHSGSKVATIRVIRADEIVSLEVEECSGISPEKLLDIEFQGVGIQGIRERAAQLGGELKIESASGGTKFSATFPFPRTADLDRAIHTERATAMG